MPETSSTGIVMLNRCIATSLWAAIVLAASTNLSAATPDELRFFETEIRPILAERCQKCHGEQKQRGQLRLDSLAAMLRGGESGPAVVPGKPDESLLVGAIQYDAFEMPPDGKLPDDEVAKLTSWVAMGAPWPGADADSVSASRETPEAISAEERAFWSFQPVREVAPPNVPDSGWCRNEIDRFIFQRLAAEGLHPSPEAERRVLIRRLYFDLVGLPPAPEEIAAFLADESPQAYEQLVDRLLDSPRYGERWARHWLDLVRYAESDGFKQDAYRPNAWRYRDYVIRAFNTDKPYDRFILEQIAGDEIAPQDLDALAATAYLRHWIYEYNQRDARTQWANILNDITDVTGDVFLGLGIGCARCHDHKFDPILQRDYYRLQAFFAPLRPRDDIPYATAEQVAAQRAQQAEWEEKTAAIRAELEELERPFRQSIANAAIDKFPKDIRPMMRKPSEQRTPFEQQLAEFAYRQVSEEYSKLNVEGKLKGDSKTRWRELRKELASFEGLKPKALPVALTVTDVGPDAPTTVIPGAREPPEIAPGFLSVLDASDAVIEPAATSNTTGRRTALAKWLTDPHNPLTTRVIVNRVWQHHFGRGIVATASDFGRLGEAPTHPELLDWLARWFVDQGWSFKRLHRLMVTSATYRQTSAVSLLAGGNPQMLDPDNRLLWRGSVRRLEAEQIRDAALAVSGELEWEHASGPSVDASQPLRTIYTKVIRNSRDPLLSVFDAPDGFSSTSERNVTTTPTQSLFSMNGSWMMERAEALARRLSTGESASQRELAESAFWRAYGRAPSDAELDVAVAFLEGQLQQLPQQGVVAWTPTSFPGRSGGITIDEKKQLGPVAAAGQNKLPRDDFTVELFFVLRSLYEDAAVRTLASQWDGNQAHPGWSLGVTSTGSAHQPRNLILQLVGKTAAGDVKYEVIPSNLRPELDRPYYAAVSVRFSETGEQGITFYLQDLADTDATLQTAQMPHAVVSDYQSETPLVLGGRHDSSNHAWHGLLDDVRWSAAALSRDELQLGVPKVLPSTVAWWRLEAEEVTADASPNGNHLGPRDETLRKHTPDFAALIDFCHVLLNSNEFLYVD